MSKDINIDYSPPPKLGQHTKEILISLEGYSKDKLDTLIKKKVIGC